MADRLVVLDRSTFFVSAPSGDVEGVEDEGFFHADMRHLSRWQLLVDGAPIRVLTSGARTYYSASIFGTLGAARVGENPGVSIRRDRIVADGVHEDIVVENNTPNPVEVEVELQFASDFADIFEIKDDLPKRGAVRIDIGDRRVTLSYEREGFRRSTRIEFSEPCEPDERAAHFRLALGPRQSWKTHVDVTCVVDDEDRPPRHDCEDPMDLQPLMPLALEEWIDQAPTLDTDSDLIEHTYRRSMLDIASLRFRPMKELEWSLPAAGLPWFMALFGRDSIITAYQALPFQPRLAATTLQALAARQAPTTTATGMQSRAKSCMSFVTASSPPSARCRTRPITVATTRRRCS